MYPASSILSLQNACVMSNAIQLNKRTGIETNTLYNTALEYPNMISNRNGIDSDFIMPEGRAYFPHIAAAELAWVLQGEKDATLIQKYSKMWSKFTNDNNEVEAAYGYRMKRHFNRDQLFDLIDLLKKDPSSRQGLVMYWDPATDGLLNQGKVKNVPCPFGFQVNINWPNLYLTVFMRSSDVVVGLPYDFMFYDQLAAALANELGLYKESVVMFSANTHLYMPHTDIVVEQLKLNELECLPKVYSTDWKLTDIMLDPEGYIEYVRSTAVVEVERRKEIYNPKPEVFE